MRVISAFSRTFLRFRRISVFAIHLVLILLANYLAFWLRFDGFIPEDQVALMRQMLPWLLLVRGLTFIPFRLYSGLWRYSGIWDLRNILVGVSLSTAAFYALVHHVFGVVAYPRSIFIIDTLLLICFMGGVRMARRLYSALPGLSRRKRVLIFGAGDTGEMILRDIKNHTYLYHYRPVGFIDDDPKKIGARIHGVRVLGNRENLHPIVLRTKPHEVIITIPSAKRRMVHDFVKSLESYNVAVKMVPNLREVKNGKVSLGRMRNVLSEDLLDRSPIGPDVEAIRRLIQGRRILVTGAAGSIGSELCRQIASYDPEMLVLMDKSEGGLFAIDTELAQKHPSLKKSATLVDIKHVNPLREVFSQYAPQIVIHAAAFKHVPMMEFYPEEAVLNNVVGSSRLAHVAIEHKVEKFVLISTDKAVNPTNVMGATKRVAEMYIDALECNVRNAGTKFSTVRFGNVLGSSGSVLPLFRKQIEGGGPVTVTHPDVTRYFMTIPEAVQLVLRAVSLAEGGEIFVLDMGEPIKLVDMARNLIRGSGLIPDKDIQIKFIGMRPGEKMHEELVGPGETVQVSGADKIRKIRPSLHLYPTVLMDRIVDMEKLAIKGMSKELLEMLCEVVPNFNPIGLNGKANGQLSDNGDADVAGLSNSSLAAAAPADKENPAKIPRQPIPVSTARGQTDHLNQQKILVVDDETEILDRMCYLLRASGWNVSSATNGKDALESVKTSRPDAIVLDMLMPVMDGFQVVQSLKSHPDYQTIPILAATSLFSRKDRERCLAAGCDDYVAKPFTIKQLQERLAVLVGNKVIGPGGNH
jgi:FlaA1/EpsC-like NDP-sugar epimerase/ActR/RegA family two-component response regulator